MKTIKARAIKVTTVVIGPPKVLKMTLLECVRWGNHIGVSHTKVACSDTRCLSLRTNIANGRITCTPLLGKFVIVKVKKPTKVAGAAA